MENVYNYLTHEYVQKFVTNLYEEIRLRVTRRDKMKNELNMGQFFIINSYGLSLEVCSNSDVILKSWMCLDIWYDSLDEWSARCKS